FDQLEALSRDEKRVAMVTLVATRGTSPKKEGAKMWVAEDGRLLGSVTIGGCVDARVIESAEAALASFKPQLLSLSLSDEDAWEGGFTCAGTIDILIEPLDLGDPADRLLNIYGALAAEVKSGRTAAVVSQLHRPESKLIVYEDGEVSGGLGTSGLDRAAREVARELIQKRISRTVLVDPDQSSTEMFFEVHGPAETLVVFGAGHVSMALVRLAKEIGLRTVVVDGRPRFATRERFPDADELLIGIPSEIARGLSYTSSTLVVLAAHDYKYDIPVLKIVLNSEALYIGMLGSRRRGEAILKFLEESGVDRQVLDRVRVPIGLDIGAVTASEI